MTDTFTVGSSGRPSIDKDYQAKLDYTFDWSSWLSLISDTIASSTVTITGDGNATIGTPATSNTITAVTVWVTGGTIGQSYVLTCKITTAAGRVDERSMVINVKDR